MLSDICIFMNKHYFFWDGGVNEERVRKYLGDLEEQLSSLKIYTLDYLIPKEIKEKIKCSIEREIDYCKFYLSYLERQAIEENFNKWYQTKEKGRWSEETTEVWIKTNGKIRAKIYLYIREKSTRVSLEIENDSQHLKFCERKKISYKNLRCEDSILKEIQRLKKYVDKEIFQQYAIPFYCVEYHNVEYLKKLFFVEVIV